VYISVYIELIFSSRFELGATPVILATPKAEIRIVVQGGPIKEYTRTYLESTQHKKCLAEWLTW
jgi:hypothetical protein